MQPPNSRIAKTLCLDDEKNKNTQYLEANGLQTMMDLETDTRYESMLWCMQLLKKIQIGRDEDQTLPFNFMVSYNRPDGVFGSYTGNISHM
ncbi:unnamed protein product, partial [Brenthis ino]